MGLFHLLPDASHHVNLALDTWKQLVVEVEDRYTDGFG